MKSYSTIPIIFFLAIHIAIGCKSKPFRSETSSAIKISPFRIAITVHYYPTTIALEVNLSQDSLKVSKISRKDSFLFSSAIQPSAELKSIGDIHFEALKPSYSNPCIDDGLGLEITVEKNSFRKNIIIENYYQDDIDKVIQFVNSHIPTDQKIWYNKKQLLDDYERCKTHMKLSD